MSSRAVVFAADGEMYRLAIARAAESLGLEVTLQPRHDIMPALRNSLAWSDQKTNEVLADMGKTLGAPWRKEHRMAALAATSVLLKES